MITNLPEHLPRNGALSNTYVHLFVRFQNEFSTRSHYTRTAMHHEKDGHF